MKLETIKEKINWKIAIIWYWKEGKSTLNFLKKLWAKDITIHDQKNIEDKEENIKYIEGKWYLDYDILKDYDLIIKSPGISPYLNDFRWLEDKITTQTDIFIDNYKWKIIWITWTKWKSTTSTVITLTLQNCWYKTILVWNIWTPVLDEVNILWDNLYDYVIYEMSSYMLEWIKPKLYIWYLNNMYDCHLDWHLWKDNYRNAKLNILRYSNYKISNIETINEITWIDWITYFWEGSNILYKENFFFLNWEKFIEDKNVILEWPHNKNNILGVITILSKLIEDWENKENLIKWLKDTLSNFSWLPYRIQNIWTYNEITFINDAMATTPDSSIAAINTFKDKIGTLFLWWQDSGFKFEKLRKLIEQYKIKNLILMPENSEKIFPETIEHNYETNFILDLWEYKPNIFKTKSLIAWIEFAYKNTEKWQFVLLSTWSPFILIDWKWNPYTVKWNLFNEYVKKIWENKNN